MEIKILEEKENKLLKRLEVLFEVRHGDGGGTPPRSKVREELARALKRSVDAVFIKKTATKSGLHASVGRANVYNDPDSAKAFEPEHIIARNTSAKGGES